jgi:predicted DNA-binding transcriptional regulator AlpA
MPSRPVTKQFITTAQLRDRWAGVSHMFIERRLASDPTFPRPVKLGGRLRLWDVDQIEAYERKCAAGRGESEAESASPLHVNARHAAARGRVMP